MVLLPAIDLRGGKCVRLLRGDFDTAHQVADDPVAVARRFRDAGAEWVHVVDLDGAKDGVRRNAELVRRLAEAASPAKLELGGGLRSLEDLAQADALGVTRFVLGSAAAEDPAFVRAAVRRYGERVAVGIDAEDGRVKTHGWRRDGGLEELAFARRLCEMGVKVIVYTDIAADGALNGPSWERLTAMREAVSCELIASGGVTALDDLKRLRELGLDGAITGKAIYTGDLPLEDAVWECKIGAYFQKSELPPCVVQDERTGRVLMLGYMNRESLRRTLQTGYVWFWSRSRGELWKKGETSGNTLRVVSAFGDCDSDALLLRCHPAGPTCHTGEISCFFREMEVFHGD
jgi:phosphoribosylformimino-5-aminoimidazole carboxamide ribotide isomerase